MEIIAYIHNDMQEKFGIPRQSGLVEDLISTVVFEPKYRVREVLDGIDGFSHLWLIWQFSENADCEWSPTVRPPRLGGDKRKGVFATLSPFRPNPIGLSCVKLEQVLDTSDYGTVLTVSGADLKNGTPIYDIKPYIAYCDSVPDASQGFVAQAQNRMLAVDFPSELLDILPAEKRSPAVSLLAQDPRPAYHNDPDRIYGMKYAGFDIKFRVCEKLLTVTAVTEQELI
ncbi:MAG: tRNA (N6-threonylcarbamoyladenosine(37)-N6)-methyltransferase TrmO [Clostridiales bacterium]|nr:tRNA (N6-threonylcarbamoyladenosine(37)-N6)-methyltransferase TrmO [Clostridiales bacterium]